MPRFLVLLGLILAALYLFRTPAVGACGDFYQVEAGDTLSEIAAQCGVELDRLGAANPGAEARDLRPGAWLAIPDRRPETRETTEESGVLSRLAQNVGAALGDADWNIDGDENRGHATGIQSAHVYPVSSAISLDDLRGGWAANAASCAVPDFVIEQGDDGGGVVVAELDAVPKRGFISDANTTFVFTQPSRSFDLERRGEDSLVVWPRERSELSLLGDAVIDRDGTPFVRCPPVAVTAEL